MPTFAPATLAGNGFVLRVPTDTDADDVAVTCDDAETARFLSGLPKPYRREHALSWIREIAPATWAGGGATFVVADSTTGRLLGSVGINDPRAGGRAAGVGYWMAPWARRRGIATEATRTVAAWAFEQGVQRLELTTDIANEASQRVALKAGFRHEVLRPRSGKSGSDVLDDRAVWVRFAGEPGDPVERKLPDLPGGMLSDGVVTLRRLAWADLDDLHRLRATPDVMARSFGAAPTLAESKLRCARAAYQWLSGARAAITVRDAATGAFVGDIGIFHLDEAGQAMIGYSLSPEWRGRGYATRTVRLVTDWAFDHAGIARVIAGTEPDNTASQRVLEKAGFRREGYERGRLPRTSGGPRIDNVAFALLATDRPG